MQQLAFYVSKYGLSLIFVNVLLEQLGLPIPAMPVLIVAGALAVEKDLSVPKALFVAVLASVLADALWYALGKRHGFRILKTLCRISLSPDGCGRQTTSIFEKWGMPSLVVAKFVPGFSTVAPPLAGATVEKPGTNLATTSEGIPHFSKIDVVCRTHPSGESETRQSVFRLRKLSLIHI